MKFSALNVNFSSSSPNSLGLKSLLTRASKNNRPLKIDYFADNVITFYVIFAVLLHQLSSDYGHYIIF